MTIIYFQRYIFLIYGLLFCAHNICAQEFRYKEYPLRAREANCAYKSIHQDSIGNMLIHIENGLYQHDGLSNHLIDDSAQIEKVIELSGKQILVIQTSGVFKLLPTGNTYHKKLFIACTAPVQVHVDQKKQTWVAEASGKILKFNGDEHAEFTIGQSIQQCFFAEMQGVLWLITAEGSWYYFDITAGGFIEVKKAGPPFVVKAILKQTSRSLWVAGPLGIKKIVIAWNNTLSETTVHQNLDVNCLLDDGRGHIFVGTQKNGLLQIRKGDPTSRIEPVYYANTVQNIEPLLARSIAHIYLDRNRDIWISSELGIGHLYAKSFLTLYNKKPLDDWTALRHADNGDYYFTKWSISGTLFRYNSSLSQEVSVANTGPSSLQGIEVDQNHVWASNSNGEMFRFTNNKRNGYINLSQRGGAIFHLLADSRHRIWLAQAPKNKSLPGVTYIDPSLNVHYLGSEAGLTNRILCFSECPISNQIYFGGVGADNYLYTLDENTQKLVNLSIKLPLKDASNVEIHDIVTDTKANVWLATTHGLLRYSLTDKTIELVDLGARMVTNGEIRALSLDKFDQLWVGTEVSGILCYKDGEAIPFTLSDGVPSKIIYFRAMETDRTGRLWAVTDAAMIFSKDSTLQISQTAQPILYGIEVNAHLHVKSPYSQLLIPANSNVNIAFHSLSYPASGLIFQWRIKEYSAKWSEETDKNFVTFSGLDHGKYTIEIRARQSGYAWSEPLIVSIQVDRVWYLKPVSIFLYFIAFFFLAFWISYLNNKRLQLKNIRLQEKVQDKTSELQVKNEEISTQNLELRAQNKYIKQQAERLETLNVLKNRLFSIISHDLRGPLGSIRGVLSLVNEGLIPEKDFKTIVPELARDMDHTSNLLDNLLHWAKSQMEGFIVQLEYLDTSELAETQIKLLSNISKTKGVELHNTIPKGTFATYDEQMLGIILRNLIANAIKFCDAGDTVHVRSELLVNWFSIIVEDNGAGISVENQAKLFQQVRFSTRGTSGEFGTGLGLLVCKEYVEKMGGTISVKSEVGKGSTFTCLIPYPF